jgi:uncharacterized membrane protein YbhN (UPF0104 family)
MTAAASPATSFPRRLALVGAWIVATALLVLCARTIDWSRAATVIGTANPWWLVPAIALNAAVLVCWAQFWKTLVPNGEPDVPYQRMFEIASTASSLMNTVPFGGGHAASIALLKRRAALSIRGALAVLALDQLGEGLAKALLFLAVVVADPLPTWMRAGVTTAFVGVTVWLIALLVLSRRTRELRLLHDARRSLGAFVCVAATKGAELLAIIAVQHAFGINVHPGGTLLVLAAVILATMLPIAPGNLGTYEAAACVAVRVQRAVARPAQGPHRVDYRG